MGLKQIKKADGIFRDITITVDEDTSIEEYVSSFDEYLDMCGRSQTPKYILETIEKNIKEYLRSPKSKSRKLTVRESDERRRRDGEDILEKINHIRKIKNASSDYLQACFFYLGCAAQRADIRLVEPDTMRGRKTLLSAKEGGETKAAYCRSKWGQWREDAEKIKKEKPSYNKYQIAGILEKKYINDPDLSAKKDTIYKQLLK